MIERERARDKEIIRLITGSIFQPLSQELLYNNSLCIDGRKICDTGFQYSKQAPTLEVSRYFVSDFICDAFVFVKHAHARTS